MPDNEVKIGLEVVTGSSKANIEQGIVAPLHDVKAAGESAEQSVTADLQKIAQGTSAAANAEKELSQAAGKVATETEREASALKELGTVAAEAGAKITAAARSEGEAITELAPAAEGAAAAISESASVGVESLGEIPPAAAEAATAVESIGESATTAAEEAKTALDETAAALDGVAAAAEQYGPFISEGMAEISGQAGLVQNAVDKFYQRLADGLAPGRGALRQISAQYSILGEQIAEAEGLTAEEAAAAQANYARIGAAIQGVIAKQREFNVELKATQFATKEGGEQFALMGLAAEQVGKHFGETGTEIGQTAGELGLLAAILPRLTIMFKAMGPALAAPFVAAVGPIVAVIATLAAAAAAGTKLAETNELNAESVNDLVTSFKKLTSTGADFSAWTGRIQAELQVLISDLLDSGVAAGELIDAIASGDAGRVAASVAQISAQYHNLSHELDAAAKAQDKEGLGARAAATAHEELKKSTHELGGEVHSGADEIGKLEEKTTKLSKTSQFYLETQKLGAAGQRLWNQALDAAAGSTQKLEEIVQKLHPEMEKLIENYHKAKAALDLQLDGIKKQIEEEKKLIETEAEESRKIQQLVTDIGTEEAARKKLRATVQGEIEDDAKLDVAKNGTSKAIQEVAQRIAELSAAFDAEQPSIDAKIAKLEELGKSTIDLSAETKKYIEEIGDEKKAIDDLTQKNKDLQKEEDALTAKGQALTKADYDRIQAIDHEIYTNQTAIQQAKDKIAADAKLLEAQQAETKATIEATGANGRVVDSQHKLTKSTEDTTKATKDAGTGLSDLAKNVHISAEKAKELSDESKGIEVSVGKAGDASEKAGGKFHETGEGLDQVAKSAHLTQTNITIVGDAATKAADKTTAAAALFKKVVEEEQAEWKKSGILVDEHTKKIEAMVATYESLKSKSKETIDSMISDLQRLDAQTKKTAGSDSGTSGTASTTPSTPPPTQTSGAYGTPTAAK